VPAIEEMKFIENAEAVPAMPAKAVETVPAMLTEGSADAGKEPEIGKIAEEQPKLLSPQ
jgi:hypothetical protein